jgi:hypothetical protein
MFIDLVDRVSYWWTAKVWGRFWGWAANLIDAIFDPQPPAE